MTKEVILKAVTHFWPEIARHAEIFQEFNLEQTIDLLDFMLSNNLINFNNHVYLQLKGVIMGDNAAPALAIIYLLYLEDTCLQKYTSNTKLPNGSTPLLFRRFIDDILVILSIHKDATVEEMKKARDDFLAEYNKMHDSVKVTYNTTIETHHTPFLDINLFTNSDHTKITISTYFKEFHKFQYLHFDSYHHPSIHSAFIFGELDRYLTHSSNEEIYNITKALFKTRLLNAGYPEEYIEKHFKRHYFDANFRKRKLYKKETKMKPISPYNKDFKDNYIYNAHKHTVITKVKEVSDSIIQNNLKLKQTLPPEEIVSDKSKKEYEPRTTVLKFPFHPFTADINMPAIIRSNPYFERLPTFLQDIVVSYTLEKSIGQMLVRANLLDTPISALDLDHLVRINEQAATYLYYDAATEEAKMTCKLREQDREHQL